mmetsp:Transcript_7713/g.19672  ORF Transcript_7713/g.19672 Transcript_7713/m.19672 type:complete len:597 (-) Transcript_7713:370-2160(-)|eukprot:CAMPEP_0198242018 /NCGR_PEP_ID=MMETSP1446-20131203/8646_1 /TAXON_ID=1461542 ORGANISM="Unidentified sp, Strain CCMP2111" /NCGR_SAMPLE_ID=MMETSP1446 /ASSEMBLY_ACC=CAM_ASM_001112 /LENGTH=596 /DNA_ID=CAMNT_0043925115 /DNA_START=197 /DNA_END=1987 /DNA_ORIENTATION=+
MKSRAPWAAGQGNGNGNLPTLDPAMYIRLGHRNQTTGKQQVILFIVALVLCVILYRAYTALPQVTTTNSVVSLHIRTNDYELSYEEEEQKTIQNSQASTSSRDPVPAESNLSLEDTLMLARNATSLDHNPGEFIVSTLLERLRMLEAEHDSDTQYKEKIRELRSQLVQCATLDVSKAFSCSKSCEFSEGRDAPLIAKFQDRKVFVGFNLHNNEMLMPHFMTELLQFLLSFKAENLFVSAYESGSDDFTPLWMELLDKILDFYKIPHRILFGDFDVRLKSRREHRIEFLANLRNRVLEPLVVLGDREQWKVAGEDGFSDDLHDAAKDTEGNPVTFDQILFINDVYFCASDLLQMMQHDADMVCAIDLFPPDPYHRQECIQKNSGFYDIWVARDIRGRRLNNCPPYFNDLPDVEVNIGKGLPIPVQCCWNGMVAMNAEPFHRGLRFRYASVTHEEQQYYLHHGKDSKTPFEKGEECSASECSILCKDLWNHNYTRIMMDPAVKVSYQEHYDWFQNSRKTAWPVVDYEYRAAELEKGSHLLHYPPPDEVECCPMKTLSGFVGDILFGDEGVCYNESTSDALYSRQTPDILPLQPTFVQV